MSANPEQRKKLILLGVCGVLFIVAGVIYFTMSGSGEPPPPEPALIQAETVQQSVREASQSGGSAAEEIPRNSPRRAVTGDGN
jgi:flagellar basal body-associated protein FliL